MATHAIEELTHSGRPALALSSEQGDLRATVIPDLAMLVCSLRHRGVELLGQRRGVAAYAQSGSTMGIPFLYPWANRLAGNGMLLGDRTVALDPASPLLRADDHGHPIHGIRSAGRGWKVRRAEADSEAASVSAELDWSADPELCALFPVPHVVGITLRLSGRELSIAVTVRPSGDVAAPMAFGFHPYLRLPGTPRAEWRLAAPVLRRALLDADGLPTGDTEGAAPIGGRLGETVYDDLYPALDSPPVFRLEDGSRRIGIRFDDGFPVAQIFAPATDDVVCVEPMTAPTNALASGSAPSVAPGATGRAAFTISVT